MTNLFQKREEGGKYLVSARTFHKVVGSKSHFTDWVKRILKYGFKEGKDFEIVGIPHDIPEKGGKPKVEYYLTIDCAMDMAMMQRSVTGRTVKEMLVELEKEINK